MTSHSLSILVVEDEALLRMQLSFMIEDAGHVVAAAAGSLSEAVTAIGQSSFDIALVDVHLQDGPTGLDVGRLLAQAGIPFLFVTANAARVPDDCCGGWGVIDKPYGEGAMLGALRFLESAIRRPPPPLPAPKGIQLSRRAAEMWRPAVAS